jgi:hypothetical protein
LVLLCYYFGTALLLLWKWISGGGGVGIFEFWYWNYKTERHKQLSLKVFGLEKVQQSEIPEK